MNFASQDNITGQIEKSLSLRSDPDLPNGTVSGAVAVNSMGGEAEKEFVDEPVTMERPPEQAPEFLTEEELIARSGYQIKPNSWVSKPIIANQGDTFPNTVRTKRFYTEFLDLKNPQDLSKYSNIVNQGQSPLGNIRIVQQTMRDFDWNVLLILEELEFKNIIPLQKKEI